MIVLRTMYWFYKYEPSRLKANFFSSDASEKYIVQALKKYTNFTHLHDVLMLIWSEQSLKSVD